MDAPTRQALRQKRSARVLRRIKARLEKIQGNGMLLPRSPVMQAIKYTMGQWSGLEHYTNYGIAEIDNNWVENGIRPCAVGKKNWLFIGSVNAGQRSAILYSILGSCLRLGLNPRDYLTWLFEHLPTATNQTIATLTPRAYAERLAKDAQETSAPESQAA